jgi:methionyl-tRNA formyltransferase
LRIVFFGTPELAVPSLAALCEAFEVTALVCQPDRPKGRNKMPQPPPTKAWAAAHGLPVHQPTKLNDGAFEVWLRAQRPGLCALVAYGRILKQPILDVPPHGFLNMHPSALPKYRGPAPIQGAILNGETETAITIMRLDADMDSGDVLLQQPFAIDPCDTTGTLSEKLAQHGAERMVEAVRRIESGTAIFTPQHHAAATYTKMLNKADGAIDWTQPAPAIHNLVRAANPWPMAQATLDGETYRILKSRVEDRSLAVEPGVTIQSDACNLIVATGDGALAIEIIQAPGKKPLPIAEFLRGRTIPEGSRFE